MEKTPLEKSRDKIKNTPFDKIELMKMASHKLRMQVWEQFEKSKIIKEMLEKEEFNFVSKEFENGLKCRIGPTDGHLIRVFSLGHGIEIEINEEIKNNIDCSQHFLESLVRSMSDSFSKSYYEMRGVIKNSVQNDEMLAIKNKNI